MPDDLDIVLPRSTSLNGVRLGCTIRDMFGPGHSPLVSGAFFMNMILNRQDAKNAKFLFLKISLSWRPWRLGG